MSKIYQKIVLMDERPQSWNTLKRMHWSKWQVEVDRCKWLILEAIGIQPEPLSQPVNLIFSPFYGNEKTLDTSNFPEKLYEDGLVAAGLLVDDNRQYVYDIIKRRGQVDRERPRVEIEIVNADYGISKEAAL